MNSATDADESFELPRWQTQQTYLANSAAAAQYPSLYGAPPQQQSPQTDASHRLPPLSMLGVHTGHQLPSAPARTRPDHLSPPQPGLSRSLSLSGTTLLGQDPAARRHPAPDDSFADPDQPSYYSSPYRTPQRTLDLSEPAPSPRRTDPYGQPQSVYQSSAIYGGGSAYPDSPQQQQPPIPSQHQNQSQYQATKPSQSFTGPKPPPAASPSYPAENSTLSPNSLTSRPRHQHSLSVQHLSPQQQQQQAQQQIPFQSPLSNTSNPTSPIGYSSPVQSQVQRHYYTPPIKEEPMPDVHPPPVQATRPDSTRAYDAYSQAGSRKSTPMEVTRQPRPPGFRRVRDTRDLRPIVNTQPVGRRSDPTRPGASLSPLRCLTTNLASTYSICNPAFRYESSHNPRRVLTKPSKPVHNDGFDNEDYDYILYVNDWLGSEDGNKYLILDVLGQGTFGQVVKCQNLKTHDVVAVKVVKNKPAYFNQSMMEVTILDMLNNQHDPNDEHHILRMLDSFVHKNHLCLVFELLSQNLYELIKQNQFQGLSTQLVKVFTAQLLDCLCVLKDARLIHCDLKPENILLKSLSSPGIKVIDFGSACHERQTVYTYIQSRFYRSPEVLLGLQYNSAIDMWSLGCIAVELFLGLPLFPGTSEYNQVTRIVEMLGLPPSHMMEHGKQTMQFFDVYSDPYAQKQYKLKSLDTYSREHNTQEQPGKQYFKATTLPEIINIAPMPASRNSSTRPNSAEIEREANNRAAFTDFCLGLLNLDPVERWTPQQARRHPFITGEKFVKRWQPYASITDIPAPAPALAPSSSDPRRPYGGLVQSQPRGSRAYQDAAAYNQQLNQHQAYTAQQQAAQATSQAYRNPYVAPQTSQQAQPPPSSAQSYRNERDEYQQQLQRQQQQQQVQQSHSAASSYAQSPPKLPAQAQQQHTGLNPGGMPMNISHNYGGSQGSAQGLGVTNPNPPSSSYYPNARARANTINQTDAIPPALARLTQMNKDLSGVGRNTLTPIINREDAMREWERRQAGKAQPAQSYPQLEYLQQQAEMAGSGAWQQGNSGAPRYPPPQAITQYQSPVQLLMDNQERRRNRGEQRQEYGSMPAPPQSSYGGPESNLGNLYIPMQPNQYVSPSGSSQAHQQSLYPSSVVSSGQPQGSIGYGQKASYTSSQPASSSRDNRRNSGMGLESWARGA